MDWQEQLAERGDEIEEQDFRGFVDSPDTGEAVVGYVAGIEENENGHYFRMEDEQERSFNFQVPTHVRRNHKYERLVGKVAVFLHHDNLDTGQPNPMHKYKVFSLESWEDVPDGIPNVADDLPF